jgi:nitrile hydratase alpha subunit
MSEQHAHAHGEHPSIPDAGDGMPGYYEIMETAVRELLVEKRLFSADEIRRMLEVMDSRTPALGAKVVARAWVDPNYKQRLLGDPSGAIGEMDLLGMQGQHMAVVENTPTVHNLVVCTLCSCYPWPLLGLPPRWYKSAPYRSRAIIDPRGVLKEFGVDLGSDTEVRVWDSTAEVRYLVLPERPAGTEKMNENELASLVTRDAMIGTARVAPPTGSRP